MTSAFSICARLIAFAGLCAALVGCPTHTVDRELQSAKAAYGDGMAQYEEGNYDAALKAFDTARGQKWSPLIDGMLARTWDAKENEYRACPYWRSLADSSELKRLESDGIDGAAELGKESTRRAAECWSKGLGLPVPVKGPLDAKVTVLVFSEFQCPFCARVTPTMAKIAETWPNDVRLAFMHQPLPFHKRAMPAAQLAVAAQLQGKFWEAHDLLFLNSRKLGEDRFDGFIEELGLDAEQARRDMAEPGTLAYIQRQMAVGQSLGARGTPTFFINGEKFVGAQPFEKFEAKITSAIADADAELANGTPRAALHAVLSRRNNAAYGEAIIDGKKPSAVAAAKPNKPTPVNTDTDVWKATVSADDHIAGDANALVTMVMFTDLQCPFCARGHKTVAAMQKKYGADLRVVFKHHPLPFHKDARPAALAALAAGEQGKFWEMADQLFTRQRQLNTQTFMAEAEALGLDTKRFKKVLSEGEKRFGHILARDAALATKLTVKGTPNFFINGRRLRGAQPAAKFEALIDHELAKAKKLVASGTPRSRVYETIIKGGKVHDPVGGPAVNFDNNDRPSVGPANAPVTLTVFTDFQCPFCSRVETKLSEVQAKLPRQVRIVYKQFPLSFHKEAPLAAQASLAAHKQNKFAQMRDELFANQRALSAEKIGEIATQIGLKMTRFNRDLHSKAVLDMVAADMAQGKAAGVRGTPSVYINGFKFAGHATSTDAIVALIKERFLK